MEQVNLHLQKIIGKSAYDLVVQAVERVIEESGYGSVTLEIHAGKVTLVRNEHKHKPAVVRMNDNGKSMLESN